MLYQIRPARREELETILQVERDAGERFRAFGLEPFEESPSFGGEHRAGIEAGTLWVATTGSDTIIGFALASVVDGEGHLREIDVLDAYGRQGIGKALIQEVMKWCTANEYPALTLTTYKDIPWNAPYYQKLGFFVIPEAELSGQLNEMLQREMSEFSLARVAMRLML